MAALIEENKMYQLLIKRKISKTGKKNQGTPSQDEIRYSTHNSHTYIYFFSERVGETKRKISGVLYEKITSFQETLFFVSVLINNFIHRVSFFLMLLNLFYLLSLSLE